MTFEEKYDPVRIVNAIMSLQETFPEGSPWSNDDIYVWAELNTDPIPTSSIISEEKQGNFLNLTCGSAILMEQNSGTILYEHNIHEQLRPASITKIMNSNGTRLRLSIHASFKNSGIHSIGSIKCSGRFVR